MKKNTALKDISSFKQERIRSQSKKNHIPTDTKILDDLANELNSITNNNRRRVANSDPNIINSLPMTDSYLINNRKLQQANEFEKNIKTEVSINEFEEEDLLADPSRKIFQKYENHQRITEVNQQEYNLKVSDTTKKQQKIINPVKNNGSIEGKSKYSLPIKPNANKDNSFKNSESINPQNVALVTPRKNIAKPPMRPVGIKTQKKQQKKIVSVAIRAQIMKYCKKIETLGEQLSKLGLGNKQHKVRFHLMNALQALRQQ